MKLAIVCDERLEKEFLSKKPSGYSSLCFVPALDQVPADANVIFDLLFENNHDRVSLLKAFLPSPVFINCVSHTLGSIGEPFIRVNAWPTFFTRDITEIVVLPHLQTPAEDILRKLGWAYIISPDTAGMISAGIVASIVNEAYHTLEEKVSTREEIDTAMKTGTNYPLGPFEWSQRIGLKNIYDLLVSLESANGKNGISALLKQEVQDAGIKKK